jgi:Tol biopolymer transport system component
MNHCLLIAFLIASARAQTSGIIAYTRAPGEAPPWPVQDVCIVNVDGARDRCLTHDGHSHNPAWSPDGTRVVFIHDSTLSKPPQYRETEDTKSHHPVELCVMDADGRNRRVLRVVEPVVYSVAWSPDGATLAISAGTAVRSGEPAQQGVFLLPASGKGELRLYRQNAWTPSWSPDGKRLAFTLEQPRGRWRVYTAKIDGSEEVAIGDANVDNGSPAWSPDGARIAFDQFTDASSRQQVFLMNADGSGKRQITTDPAWSCMSPSWSPDGTHLAVSCRSAGSPCGMGVFSTGQKMPECTRRVFVLRADPASPRTMVVDHDGAMASFSPVSH